MPLVTVKQAIVARARGGDREFTYRQDKKNSGRAKRNVLLRANIRLGGVYGAVNVHTKVVKVLGIRSRLGGSTATHPIEQIIPQLDQNVSVEREPRVSYGNGKNGQCHEVLPGVEVEAPEPAWMCDSRSANHEHARQHVPEDAAEVLAYVGQDATRSGG